MKNFCTLSLVLAAILLITFPCMGQAQTCSGIYVTPNGSSTGPGTQVSPANLVHAIDLFNADTTRRIIEVLEGTHFIYQTLLVPSNIVIDGGYKISGAEWVKGDSTHQSILDISPYNLEYDTVYDPYHDTLRDVVSLIGIKFSGVSNIYMSDLTVRLHGYLAGPFPNDGWGGGYTVYGIYASRSKTVLLNKLSISTDKAGDGYAGLFGRNGASAFGRQAGGWQVSPYTTNSQDPIFQMVPRATEYTAGGIGGKG